MTFATRVSVFALMALSSLSAYGGGVVIYKRQPFHQDSQALLREYNKVTVTPRIVTIWVPSGQKFDVSFKQSPVLIPAPDGGNETPTAAINAIASAIERFPQHRAKLEELQAAWESKKRSDEAAFQTGPARSADAKNPAGDEQTTLKGGRVVNVYPDGVTISTGSGIEKVGFSEMSEDEKERFGYDPQREKEYLEKMKEQQKAALERQKALEEQEKVASAERDKRFWSDVAANTTTIKEVESDLPGFLNKQITIQGTIDLDSYYNYAFRGEEKALFCFRVQDKTGTGYLYLKRGPEADALRQTLISKNEPIAGRFTLVIPEDLYESAQSQVLGLLMGVSDAIKSSE